MSTTVQSWTREKRESTLVPTITSPPKWTRDILVVPRPNKAGYKRNPLNPFWFSANCHRTRSFLHPRLPRHHPWTRWLLAIQWATVIRWRNPGFSRASTSLINVTWSHKPEARSLDSFRVFATPQQWCLHARNWRDILKSVFRAFILGVVGLENNCIEWLWVRIHQRIIRIKT